MPKEDILYNGLWLISHVKKIKKIGQKKQRRIAGRDSLVVSSIGGRKEVVRCCRELGRVRKISPQKKSCDPFFR